MNPILLLPPALLTILAIPGLAQGEGPPRPEGKGGCPPREAGPPRGDRPPRDDQESDSEERPDHRPPPPLIRVFDTDEDGVLSEEEIDNASEALSELDRNNDGEITREELHPPRPDGDEAAPPRWTSSRC